MNTTDTSAVAATAYATIGSVALSSPSFSAIQRNRGNRFSIDLSDATVIGVLQAYEAKKKKSNPRYSVRAAIHILEEIQEHERVEAETAIKPDGSRAEWEGPFMPIDVCADFWVAFESYYVSTPDKLGRRRHASSAETYACTIIAALRWSQAYGVKLDPTFSEKKFSHYKKKKITPTHDQISLIYHFDLDAKETRRKCRELAPSFGLRLSFTKLKRVKDHFVLSCNLGQRISDMKRIDPTMFTGFVFETTQQKTGNHARVDMQKSSIDFDVVKEILDRYNWYAPAYGMDTSLFNKYLHLLCKVIGGPFDREVTWGFKVGGEIIRESAYVWERFTSHTARSSFITRLVEKGTPMPDIMRQSGHRDARNMNTYYVPDHH